MRPTIPLDPKILKRWLFIVVPSIFILSVGFLRITSDRTIEQTNATTKQALACNTTDLSGNLLYNENLAFFDGENLNVPSTILADTDNEATAVLGVGSPDEKWIEVDLSEQKLKAWDGTNLFLETAVSTGYGPFKTPTGEFRIWVKLRATKMSGGSGSGYYYLPNVPYVMYFGNAEVPNYRGYGLHGTYWHNDFGNPRSHGCVNLPTEKAKELYFWTTPNLIEGKGTVYSDDSNVGTRIVIHE